MLSVGLISACSEDAARSTGYLIEQGTPSSTHPAQVEEVSLPGQTSAVWWATAQEDIGQSEYNVTWQDRTFLTDLPAAYHAPNRAHNLRTYFSPTGIRAIPRIEGRTYWEFDLRLIGYGYEGAVQPVASASLTAQGNRVEYRRAGLKEWYVNDEQGLEQGFDITAPPVRSRERDGTEYLVLELELTGDLSPSLADGGRTIELATEGGLPVLRYGGLSVEDAAGSPLPAYLVLGPSKISILIDDRTAIYPVVVDPLVTSPSWTAEVNQELAYFGYSVGTAGDVNGDGYSDVIVGAYVYDNGQSNEGGAFVYHGSAAGLSTTADWTAESNQAGALFGRSVGTAGDVNGDGYSDVTVGAYIYDSGETNEGRAFVYQGSAATTTVVLSDLAVTKSDSPDPVIAGTTMTYTLTVTNAGPATSTDVTLIDTLPWGVSFVSSTPGSCAELVGAGIRTVTCSLGTLATNISSTVIILVDVPSTTTNGTILTNAATVTATEVDPNSGNSNATATTNVIRSSDLVVTKSGAPDPVVAGTSLTYTLTTTNAGPSDATGVTVTDPLPVGVTLISATATQGSCTGGTTITCSLGELAANASTTVTIQVGVNSSTTGNVTNTASVVGNEPDPDDTNDNTTSVTTVNAEADLLVTEAGPPDPVTSSTTLSYAVNVTNNGPSDATVVTLTDTLPDGVAYATSTPSTTACAESGGMVTCSLGTLGTLGAGDTASLIIQVNLGQTTTGFITNTVTVASNTTDPDLSDNTATQVTVVRIHPDLPSLQEWGLIAMAVIIGVLLLLRLAPMTSQPSRK